MAKWTRSESKVKQLRSNDVLSNFAEKKKNGFFFGHSKGAHTNNVLGV